NGWNGLIDEFALWNRTLNNTEIRDVYERGALRLDVSVRSCDDVFCSGETYTDIDDISPQTLSVANNTYFQLRVNHSRGNASFSPIGYNISVVYEYKPALSDVYYNVTSESFVFGVGQSGSIANLNDSDDVIRTVDEGEGGVANYTLFFETFGNDVEWTNWTESGDGGWDIGTNEENLGGDGSNLVAHIDNCDNLCYLTVTNAFDLQNHTHLELDVWRWIENTFDTGEYVRVEIYNGSWSILDSWDGDIDDDNTWHNEFFNLTGQNTSIPDFGLRFVGHMSLNNEDAEIDNVTLLTGYTNYSMDANYTIDSISTAFSTYTLSVEGRTDGEVFSVYADGVFVGNITSLTDQTFTQIVTSSVSDGQLNVTFVDNSRNKEATQNRLYLDRIQVQAQE
ncbi:hypothetical protein COT72_05680, partial [archaeon CG10_big_fil_rev_8_21_14_0_10_43_11]